MPNFRKQFVRLILLTFFSFNDGVELQATPKLGFLDFIFNPCKCKCGLPNREARLVGGEYLRGYEFPWLALIQIKGVNSVSGTLINNRYVLTAASQLIGLTPLDIKVTLGQFDRCFPDVSSLNISVGSIISHQDFNPGNRAHDIALLRLASPITFEKRISPVCLSTPGATYLGQVATFVGWAVRGDDKETACRPRKLGLPVLDYIECLGTASNPQFVSVDKGCAGVVGSRNVVCKTDAGGPVLYRSYGGVYELIGTMQSDKAILQNYSKSNVTGILTDQNECTEKPSTALYVTVNSHLSWITRNTVDACYCLKT